MRPADDGPSTANVDADEKTLRLSETFDIAGRRWTVVCAAVPQFVAMRTTWYPWCVAAAGLLLTGLLAMYLIGISKQHAKTTSLPRNWRKPTGVWNKKLRSKASRVVVAHQPGEIQGCVRSVERSHHAVDARRGFSERKCCRGALYGCKDEEEFTSCGPADLSPEYQPDGSLSSEKAQQMMGIALEDGFNVFQWKHKKIDGTEFFSNVSLTRMELEGKRFLQAVVRDISEQERTQEALRTGEQRLRLFVENVSDVVWTMDFSGCFTYMSPSMQRCWDANGRKARDLRLPTSSRRPR